MKIWTPFARSKPTPRRRSFAGAMMDRLTADWVAMSTSQDAEIRASLPRLRNRSRELGRNNDYARSFFREVENNVIGLGIPFQAQVKMKRGAGRLDEKTNLAIEDAFFRWSRAENCHTAGKLAFQDIERLVVRSVFESGEVIIRKIYQRFGQSRIPLALEVIESDLLDDNYNAISPAGNAIRMGVEVDSWGRPVAYWFLQRHPGDYGVMPNSEKVGTGNRKRVPAEEIIHLFNTERTGQTRGIPALASTILRLRHMQGYEEAEVIAARANAAQMGFLETPEEEMSIKDGTEDGQSVTEFEPGLIKKLAPGEKYVQTQNSRPGGQFDPFIRLMIRGVAAGCGASYESISKDFSQSNYSSSRQALLQDRDNWRVIQAWIIRAFHQKILESWMDMAVLAGELSLADYELQPALYQSVKWMPRGWAWVDPLKEVEALTKAVRSGFMTQAEVIAQSGGDVDELIAQRKREVELAKQNDLKFESDPGSDAPKVAPGGDKKPPAAE
jgi:lambda family phage portal protein